jgi:hypothetical protein
MTEIISDKPLREVCRNTYDCDYEKLLKDLETALNKKPMYPSLKHKIERDIKIVKDILDARV